MMEELHCVDLGCIYFEGSTRVTLQPGEEKKLYLYIL